MAKPLYLLDLHLLAELTRPTGNRRVFTLFQQRQAQCALAAPVIFGLSRGIEAMPENARREQLGRFLAELLNSGPPVLPFDREAATWLARESVRRRSLGRAWNTLEGQLVAIAAVNDLILVTRSPQTYAGTEKLRLEDWFRP